MIAVVDSIDLAPDHFEYKSMVLDAFFGDSAAEVIDILDEMVDQVPQQDQMLVRNIVGAARQHFAGTPPLEVEEGEEGDDDAD